ncbi:glycosyltransferase [Comamonadaceae bacterium M7527]|nr:glycosyltransferase [Comamonadaceae bacterium M7527]
MKISVITVSYNSAPTIADTVHSVASQKHTDIEHLVIDGLSIDDTVKVVKANRHPNLVLSSEKDMGIYDAMNKGLDRATGDIIGFLNADDFYADAEVLTRVAQAFESDPSIEACFGDLVYVSEDNRKVVRYWKSRPYVKGSFAHGWCPAHPTFYIRRTALNRLGQFDLNYRLAADAEFMMRYLELGAVKSTYIPHIQVRMRLGGATNQSWRNIVRQNREILHAFKKNCIPYSLPSFVFHKLASRVWQRLAGLNMLKSS